MAENFQQSWFTSNNRPASNTSRNEPQLIGFMPQFSNNQHGLNQETNTEENSAQSKFQSFFLELKQRIKPWTEFFKFSKFGCPTSLISILPRIKYNLLYFSVNYLCFFLALFIYCILTSFLMLIALIVLGGLCYTIYQKTSNGPIVIKEYEIPPSLMYTLALLVCFPLFVFADVGQVMYWIIAFGFFLIFIHSTFYASEEIPGSEFEVVTVTNA